MTRWHHQIMGLVLALMFSSGMGWAGDDFSGLKCAEFRQYFFQQVPQKVYAGEVDALYDLVLAADTRCDFGEPLGRMRILASIWDGNFQETLYGYEVVDWLVDRYEPFAQPMAGTAQAAFDTFSTEFADQLLPHVPHRSLEEFFCLYYAGYVTAAWELLATDDLADTWLHYYHAEAVAAMSRGANPYLLAVHGGWWSPRGDMGFVGPKILAGGMLEQRWSRWFGRMVMEWRLGRAAIPYPVDAGGVAGRSDRWAAILWGLEVGRRLGDWGPHQVDVFAGAGLDLVHPFKDEKVNLIGLNLSAGLGYRFQWGRARRWFVGVDGRTEFVGARNGAAQNLGGTAWSARLSLGVALAPNPASRLRALGQ